MLPYKYIVLPINLLGSLFNRTIDESGDNANVSIASAERLRVAKNNNS